MKHPRQLLSQLWSGLAGLGGMLFHRSSAPNPEFALSELIAAAGRYLDASRTGAVVTMLNATSATREALSRCRDVMKLEFPNLEAEDPVDLTSRLQHRINDIVDELVFAPDELQEAVLGMVAFAAFMLPEESAEVHFTYLADLDERRAARGIRTQRMSIARLRAETLERMAGDAGLSVPQFLRREEEIRRASQRLMTAYVTALVQRLSHR